MTKIPCLLLLILVTVVGCSTDSKTDYPSRNQPPMSAKAGVDGQQSPQPPADVHDPMQEPGSRVPSGPMVPVPGSEPAYPGVPGGGGDWTTPGGDYGSAEPLQPPPGDYAPADPLLPPPGGAPGYAGPRPLFVVMGGYKSCQYPFNGPSPADGNLFAAYHAFEEKFTAINGFAPAHVMTCYEDRTPAVRFVTSADPQTAQLSEEGDLTAVIRAMAAPETPLVFIGHSYGGWLAMKTIAAMGAQQRVAHLYTLDPISANECTRPFTPGCRRFPRDFGAEQLELISATTGSWVNVYQRLTPYLMSGKTPYATANVLRFAKHGSLDTDPKVWALISDKLLTTQILARR